MFTSINLKVNCGFARVAMYELKDNESARRSEEYQSLFPHFSFSETYFKLRSSGSSTFDDNCKVISQTINKKWYLNW